jgi:hypothetical protein
MKKIIAILKTKLCPACGRGAMISDGLVRSVTTGEFLGRRYRKCSNPKCDHTDKSIETYVGVEVEVEPEDQINQPCLFPEFLQQETYQH